jgi:hypothetical protein
VNCGSVDSFEACAKCGLGRNAHQAREMADGDMPVTTVIDRTSTLTATGLT